MFLGQIDSISLLGDLFVIAIFNKKKELVNVNIKNDSQDAIGDWKVNIYIQNGQMICYEEQYFPVVLSRGPNFYEKKYATKYYFKNNKLIYQKSDGTDEYIQRYQKVESIIINDFNRIKTKLMKIVE